jgi:hypothetical protein
LVIFEVGSRIYSWVSLDYGPLLCTSWVAGMSGACHRAQLFKGLTNFLPQLVSNPDLPDLHLLSG